MASTKTNTKNNGPDLKTICRLCLKPEMGTVNIFQSHISIPVRIMACASFEVHPTDGLPSMICEKCRYQLEVSYYFRKKCQISDGKLRKHIRLLNAGKKSRVFLKCTEDDDDDDDEEEVQCEESIQFIRAQDEKLRLAEEAKHAKWLEEQKEQFRKEETQKLFEEFGNFMQSRKQSESIKQTDSTQNLIALLEDDSPSNTPTHIKKENSPKRRRIAKPLSNKVEADNEITSSEQIPDGDEQAILYGNDEVESQENTSQSMPTFFVYEKPGLVDDNDMMEKENFNDLDEDSTRDNVMNVVEENEMHTDETQEEDNDDYVFSSEYEECNNEEEFNSRLADGHVVESYSIEENGDIQFLKEEEDIPEVISTSDEEVYENVFEDTEEQYTPENEMEISSDSQKTGRQTHEIIKPKKSAQKLPPELESAVLVSTISTEDLKIFKCSDCPQSFTREHSLMRHRSAHKNGREYTCEHCEKFFSCKSSLDRHYRIHTGEKPFTCEQCGKNFMQKEVLKRHLAIHTGDRPHKCPHCPRSFVQKLLMTQHINATHLEVPKIQKHVCHLCPKSFLHASGMSRHLLTHSGLKYSCSECGRSFNDKSSLRRHLAAVHIKQDQSSADSKADASANDSSSEYKM